MSTFKTTAIYLSGAICGDLWMPCTLAGKSHCQNARGPWGFWPKGEGWTMRDALDHVLMKNGGDFRDALFTEDTEIVIERVAVDGPGRRRVHVRTLSLARFAPDLVRPDSFAGDFFGDCDD